MWKKGIVYVLVVVYNSDIQIGDLFMKRLIKGLLAMATLLVGSCGNEVVLLKRHHVVIFYINRDNPLEPITCDMRNDITDEKYQWEGVVHSWIPDPNLSYYFSGYLFEYSNGTNVAIYGTLRN